MAEGLLCRLVPPGVAEVVSAGTDPKPVNRDAIWSMAEIGIDISGQRSKSLDAFWGQEFDYAITLCDEAQQVCPEFPGAARHLHWSLADPAAAQGTDRERMVVFRMVRNELAAQIEELMEGILDRFLFKVYEEVA